MSLANQDYGKEQNVSLDASAEMTLFSATFLLAQAQTCSCCPRCREIRGE